MRLRRACPRILGGPDDRTRHAIPAVPEWRRRGEGLDGQRGEPLVEVDPVGVRRGGSKDDGADRGARREGDGDGEGGSVGDRPYRPSETRSRTLEQAGRAEELRVALEQESRFRKRRRRKVKLGTHRRDLSRIEEKGPSMVAPEVRLRRHLLPGLSGGECESLGPVSSWRDLARSRRCLLVVEEGPVENHDRRVREPDCVAVDAPCGQRGQALPPRIRGGREPEFTVVDLGPPDVSAWKADQSSIPSPDRVEQV